MARKKLSMRQIQEILRLKHQNQLSVREIGREGHPSDCPGTGAARLVGSQAGGERKHCGAGRLRGMNRFAGQCPRANLSTWKRSRFPIADPSACDANADAIKRQDARHSRRIGIGGGSRPSYGEGHLRPFKNLDRGQKGDRRIFSDSGLVSILGCKSVIIALILLVRNEVVAGDGIEPPTQGFSVLCSTD